MQQVKSIEVPPTSEKGYKNESIDISISLKTKIPNPITTSQYFLLFIISLWNAVKKDVPKKKAYIMHTDLRIRFISAKQIMLKSTMYPRFGSPQKGVSQMNLFFSRLRKWSQMQKVCWIKKEHAPKIKNSGWDLEKESSTSPTQAHNKAD
eukprot:TRINITY_DN13822_c0_g1_i1.p2 TRINITY_DN13822_c0_g1~~TRINITY_DN13822_c0_g1_i1.p2  ORF type:complete len:150 (-),score=3.88 TRINITY_DN13822_c0_g1_i1:50-499(-)